MTFMTMSAFLVNGVFNQFQLKIIKDMLYVYK